MIALIAAVANAQQYTSVVVFGDSLSDTGNDAHLTQLYYGFRLPGPLFDYTDGRFTDGMDTVPAAHNYFGVWVEQLAATFPAKPPVKASLEGGKDYAYGFAFTGSGTTDFALGRDDELSITINNVGQQISDYLATHPKIDDKTLFVVWAGANDVINATSGLRSLSMRLSIRRPMFSVLPKRVRRISSSLTFRTWARFPGSMVLRRRPFLRHRRRCFTTLS